MSEHESVKSQEIEHGNDVTETETDVVEETDGDSVKNPGSTEEQVAEQIQSESEINVSGLSSKPNETSEVPQDVAAEEPHQSVSDNNDGDIEEAVADEPALQTISPPLTDANHDVQPSSSELPENVHETMQDLDPNNLQIETTDPKLSQEASAVPVEQGETDGEGIDTRVSTPFDRNLDQSENSDHIEDNKPSIPVDFYYDVNEYTYKPHITEDSGLPESLLRLNYSFGFNCLKRDNLHLVDQNTICVVAGNFVNIINLETKEQKYIQSSSGGAIGALAVHPSRKYIAVAEKGLAPSVLVYDYPNLRLYRILRGGTEKAYAYCKFSPDGDYLATVGCDPDFMLTIWNWMDEKTVLRSKAFSQDIYRVSWSQELEGYLTTAGIGHIRFWKMAHTFTGLKLQGAIGKFGKTELSDIEGFVELPDGKVLSGCEWGNMLLWDGGLIKVEISRKGKKNAHSGPIQQIVMDAGELMTVGIDGCIQTWDFELIDTAEASDESGLIEMEPMNSYLVGENVKLVHIVKTLEPDTTEWLAQDSNGGIWKLDLSFSHTALKPECLLSFHSGSISSSDVSFASYLVATLGEDGAIKVYDFVSKRQLIDSHFNCAGTKICWAPECVDPKGRTIYSGFSDGVLRILNFAENSDSDPIRRAKKIAELSLIQALKPHSGAITCILVDPLGDVLVTAGLDSHGDDIAGSIFFFSIASSQYSPIGFTKVDGKPIQLVWINKDTECDCLRVFLEDGRVCDLECPDPAQIDVSKTYELSNCLPISRFKFASVKSKLRRDEELAIIHKKEEEESQKKAEERKRNLERGLETEEDQQKQIEEEEKERAKRRAEEAEWEPYIPEEPSPILSAVVLDTSTFWLSMGGYDAGYFYECTYPKLPSESYDASTNPPINAVPLKQSSDIPVACIHFSNSGKRAFLGLQNGSIRVQFLEKAFDVSSMLVQYTIPVHDNEYGCITSLKTSFDDRFLVSVGNDGNFFVFDLMSEDLQEQFIQENKATVPSARKPPVGQAPDIEDPSAYSIEEDKQKSEYDRKVKLAEEKKVGIRRQINELRLEFKKFKDTNLTLPERIQLRPREFDMIPQLKDNLLEQREGKLKLVEKEMGWEAEKCQIALNKLKNRFRDELECDLIYVKAIESRHQVSTIRSTTLSSDFFALKAEIERKRLATSIKDLTRDPTLLSTKETTAETTVEEKEEESPLLKTNLKGARGERILRQLRKVEEKKRKRAQRRLEWDELNSSRPSDDYDDPADVKSIQEARDNMGDFKLKSANDYIVPPHLRMSSDKARQKLIELDEHIYSRKNDFNQRVLKLRDHKLSLIRDIQAWCEDLKNIHQTLSPEMRKSLPSVPVIDISEVPEKKFEYTRESLTQFKAEMEAKKAAQVTGEEEHGFGAFKKPTTLSELKPGGRHTPGNFYDASGDTAQSSPTFSKSKLQQERETIACMRALYQQDSILKKISTAIQAFDADLRILRHEKFDLDCKLKRAEMRQITLYEEFQLLQEFEKSEGTLANRVEQKGEEKIEIQNKVVECSNKSEAKRKDIERIQEKEKLLYDTFKESLGENNKFFEYLTKVFKKRIKRKKKEKEGDDSEDESETESEDESDIESEEEDSEDEGQRYDLDICPPGCDQTLYDNTCALREKRLDIEEELSEERKLLEAYKKELETYHKRARAIDIALSQAEKELEAFQLEKQHKLNQLETVVTLRLHQIIFHENGHLPGDLTSCLIFEKSTLLQLKRRITELEEEKLQQAKEQREAKKRNIQLNKDRKLYQAHIDDMEIKCEKMMVEKFGKVEDMEQLEQIVVNPKIEELTVKMLTQQEEMLNELERYEDKIRMAKDNLIHQTRENTKRLTQMLMLYNEKMDLEKQIDSRQKNLGSEYQGARASDIEEIERLMQLVQIQAQELNALKEEISMLSRKGGHILPPVQPPLPPPGGL